jgi:VanZ family protein
LNHCPLLTIGLAQTPSVCINSGRLLAALWWAVTIAWAGVIFGLSTDTFSPTSTGRTLAHILSLLHIQLSANVFDLLHDCVRKLAHLSEYAILALLLYRTLRREHQLRWCLRTAICVLLAAAAYSLSDEFHQRFVSSRSASLMDCGMDTLGATLGVMATYTTSRLTRQHTCEPSA